MRKLLNGGLGVYLQTRCLASSYFVVSGIKTLTLVFLLGHLLYSSFSCLNEGVIFALAALDVYDFFSLVVICLFVPAIREKFVLHA